jgi:hypothetical protein
MDGGQNSWRDAAVAALAPGERAELAAPAAGEDVVGHLVRIARNSRRAKARQAAVGALFPAARDRLPGVAELAEDLLRDPSRFVRYEACRALAVTLDPASLTALEAALKEGVEVPWQGLERAIRAVRAGNRNAFHDEPDRTRWVVQDEQVDHSTGGVRVLGSAAYGTARG